MSDDAQTLPPGQPAGDSSVTILAKGARLQEFEVTGVVGKDRSDVFAPDRVQEGMGMLEPPAGPQVILVVKLDEVAPRGYEIEGTVLVSERTLLQQLLGMT